MQDPAAPFGSWDVDLDILVVQESNSWTPLHLNSRRHVMTHQTESGTYAVKWWYTGEEDADVLRQLCVGLQAGDCVVPPVGRVFEKDTIIGYVMRQETTFDPRLITSKDDRYFAIREVCDLVSRLHAKGIVHGDVKRMNLVRCADGALRFIDLECMSVVGDGFVASVATDQYISQQRQFRHGHNPEALSFDEDYHSLALLIFEISTRHDDFYGFGLTSSENLEDWSTACTDVSLAGMPPDVSQIDDPEIAQLIMSYFNRGPPRILSLDNTETICVLHELPLRCMPGARHTYTRLVQCLTCSDGARTSPCPRLFVAPPATEEEKGSPACVQCLPHIKHTGLD
ncbi:uncharacterized protein SCHCODRAFT_02616073 [Schizophyllum commune H4-8]|uniref:Protein kinase domain-containing protein n=1 Tax=Schizophyllum commune (strain H4-8 / FGSC 9210) TaxID=578458 RepID=D8PXE5_SCHCM|nr:uncharacterized protein SCHCODRAFT_02616073 [Schizophyllum commune H4-8]KAI5896884.1 hypothetical protein SCHCODRAFT_02616073 [Schizophyllum commune H4-8]